MRLIIVSGMSGSGKSVALHMLEDLEFYCVDNLPVSMLSRLTDDLLQADDPRSEKVAIGIDARNRRTDLDALPQIIKGLRAQGVSCEIIFLQTDDDTLLKRYSETRRKHPLSNEFHGLRDAIIAERERLGPIINTADLIIDTTRTSVYELRDLIRERIAARSEHELSILVESFGYKHGIPPDADFVFDLRCLPNPYWHPKLRPQTGMDAAVADFLRDEPLVATMHDSIYKFVCEWLPQFQNFNRSYLTIALGCTGGQHRSVYMAEKLATSLRGDGTRVNVRHNELVSRTSPLFA